MVSNKELIKFEEVSSTLMLAEPVLIRNRKLFDAADEKAKSLLDTIEAEGMNDELDSEVNKWQLNAKVALAKNYERRSPITQLLTKIAQEFTSLENPLNPQQKGSIYNRLQDHRNAFATEKERLRKAKEAEILREQNVKKERVTINAEIERQIRAVYNDKLFAFKAHVSTLVSSMTIENFEEKKAKLLAVAIEYPRDKFNEISVNIRPIYLNDDEKNQLIDTVRSSLYDELSANFRENMEADKQQAIDELPSKKKELERIAKAGAEEAALLKQQADDRERLEAEKLRLQQADAVKAAERKIEADKSLNDAQTLFDTHAQLAEVKDTAGKVKKSYVINVKDNAGWGAIFMFYFEKMGLEIDVETFGKKTMIMMKKECEKFANKTSEMIDHSSIEYIEDVKAVITK